MYSKFPFIKYQGNQKSYSKKHVMGKTTEKKCLMQQKDIKLKKLLHSKRNPQQDKEANNHMEVDICKCI